jgi:hypothetical protein
MGDMMIIKNKSLQAFVLIVLVLSISLNVLSQTPLVDQGVDQQVKSFEVTDSSLSIVLQRVATKYHLSVAFEALPSNNQPPDTFSLNVQESTVHVLLDSIILNNPGYKWTQSNQIIEVYPTAGKAQLMRKVLNNFRVNQTIVDEAVDMLFNSPEIQSELKNAHLLRSEIRSFPADDRLYKNRFSLDLRQATVWEILNAIASASKSNFWSFVTYGERNQYCSVTFAFAVPSSSQTTR